MTPTTFDWSTFRHTHLRRERVLGVVYLLIGLLIWFLFFPGVEPGAQAKFGLNLVTAVKPPPLPDLVVPAREAILIIGLIASFIGGYQLARGFRDPQALMGVILILFFTAFIVWATAGKSFNLTGMLASTLLRATPIAFGALSGVWCERTAVINIGIEGMMLSAAFTSVVVASATHNLWWGLVAAMLTGGVLGLILAVLAIHFRVDQIIAGTAINTFAVGLTSFLGQAWLAERQDLNAAGNFKPIPIPLLAKIPILGPIFFNVNVIIYIMMGLVIFTHIVLFYTRWGLRMRAVGEHPEAADTLGVNVYLTRYVSVTIGGIIAGLGGAYFTLGSVGRFDEVMTAGKGFIGLAAMIFGKWTPIGGFVASLIFGLADALQVKMAIMSVPIPSEFLLMAPYLVTIVVLSGVVGRAEPPAADGKPYVKE